ncbi:tRNA (adenosine(37)-N6)-dimethylallyltransferase MiaA [Rosettibacter firmus]|uniref:tRNA (adenosine(37)-N6)-dimethylallyltransferase MiaA n=1 Tax=Rosettibacter firmus TaxID=3111522 RepID=UPI00336C006A
MSYNLITILGPTAVGKTKLAALLANHFDGEIISADSRQVYKRMNIGTGKDLEDYIINGKKIPYYLIDIVEPTEEFNLFLFNEYFYKAFNDITSRNKIPFLVGGTGLYLHSILKGYKLNKVEFSKEKYEELDKLSIEELRERLIKVNPKLHNTTDLLEKDRIIRAIIISEAENNFNEHPEIRSLTIGINPGREKIKERITERLKYRLENGMIEEVEKLVAEGITFDKLEFFGLEYKYIGMYLKCELNYNDMFQKLNSAIQQFAKRQMTWFRKMEREGIKIHWLEEADFDAAKKIIEDNYFA